MYVADLIGCGTHRHVIYDSPISYDEVLQQMITDFDKQYSRFVSDSLLHQYQRGEIGLEDDVHLATMITLGQEYTTLTDGRFSLSVGKDLVALGYGHEATTLDLGGIGKGYLIQLLAEFLQSQGVITYRINGGGDILISQDNIDVFGPVVLQHPQDEMQSMGEISVLHGAMASSGTQRRHRGADKHHLIDTTTGDSSHQPYLSVHVAHEDIVRADIAATTLFVTPPADFEMMADRLGVERLLVLDDLKTLRSEGFVLEV